MRMVKREMIHTIWDMTIFVSAPIIIIIISIIIRCWGGINSDGILEYE
jgi:hypothetical protein